MKFSRMSAPSSTPQNWCNAVLSIEGATRVHGCQEIFMSSVIRGAALSLIVNPTRDPNSFNYFFGRFQMAHASERRRLRPSIAFLCRGPRTPSWMIVPPKTALLMPCNPEPAFEVGVQRWKRRTYYSNVRFDAGRYPRAKGFPGDVVRRRRVDSRVIQQTMSVMDAKGSCCADTTTSQRVATMMPIHQTLTQSPRETRPPSPTFAAMAIAV
jgi:hypothetical protein